MSKILFLYNDKNHMTDAIYVSQEQELHKITIKSKPKKALIYDSYTGKLRPFNLGIKLLPQGNTDVQSV